MKAYELLKDGQIVHTFRSTVTTLDGRQEHLTKGEVGHAGQVFTSLAQHEIDAIDAGEREDVFRVIDLPDPGEESEEPTPETVVVPPATATRGRRQRTETETDDA
jgi:hypothetical protein